MRMQSENLIATKNSMFSLNTYNSNKHRKPQIKLKLVTTLCTPGLVRAPFKPLQCVMACFYEKVAQGLNCVTHTHSMIQHPSLQS
jgi:hypothetical protein